MIRSIKSVFKTYLKIDSKLFAKAQKFYYQIKFIFDYIFFRFRYPLLDWKKNPVEEKGFIGKSYSQFGQDFYILNTFFKGKKGFFVEIGCNHPIRLSNSYLLELNGWEGISIDPLKTFEENWQERSSRFIVSAVSNVSCKVGFVEFMTVEGWEHTLSAFKKFVKPEDLACYPHKVYEVLAAPLHELIEPRKIDVLMIDVEGAEKVVLEGIDFNRFAPKLILIENDHKLGGDESLRKILREKGFKLRARLGVTDDIFVKI